jgi:hypothetical protein
MTKPDKVITAVYNNLIKLNQKRTAAKKRGLVIDTIARVLVILIIIAKFILWGVGLYYLISLIF